MGVNSLPKTVIRQRRGCDLNPGPSAPEYSTLTTRLRLSNECIGLSAAISLSVAANSGDSSVDRPIVADMPMHCSIHNESTVGSTEI